jgi:hypothetical protein
MKDLTGIARAAATCGLLFLACIAPNCLFGQQTGIPTYRTETTEVLVPTLVTDQEGNVIFGLTVKDFVIKDNGFEQTVLMDRPSAPRTVAARRVHRA